ncbi:MAG: uroporphyrinogen decarboxylase family protein [Planctomycetes bacterium]|nr:uroporphyrinogen decarboxylase family protein [Planctomycetota bacterium]
MSAFTSRVLSTPIRQVMPVATFPGAKLVGRTVREMATDAHVQAEVSLALRARLGMPWYQSAMDLSVEAEAFGAAIRMVDDEVPTVIGRLVTDADSVAALAVPRVGAGRTQVYIDTVRLLAAQPGDPFVIAGCIGPFTLAGRLFGVSESLEFAMNEPEAMEALIEKATTFLISYVSAFKDAGAKALFMAEPTAGLLSPKMLGRFSSPYVKRIIEATEDGSFGIILHNCGAKIAHIPSILASGATALHFGQPMDLPAAARAVPAGTVVCGNLDPSGVFVGLDQAAIAQRTIELERRLDGLRNVVMSSGCDIPPNAPVENLVAYMRACGVATGGCSCAHG